MATAIEDDLFDNSQYDETGRKITGTDVDLNPTRLARILDGTTGTTMNGAASPAMNFTNIPYTLDHKVGKIRVYNNSGGALSAGDYLYVSAYNSGQSLYEVKKAVVTNANATTLYATLIADAAISNAAAGNACCVRVLTGLNTSGLTVGRPVYLSNTAGGWVGALSSLPDTDYRVQVVGFVAEAHASTGRIIQCPREIIPYSLAWDV